MSSSGVQRNLWVGLGYKLNYCGQESLPNLEEMGTGKEPFHISPSTLIWFSNGSFQLHSPKGRFTGQKHTRPTILLHWGKQQAWKANIQGYLLPVSFPQSIHRQISEPASFSSKRIPQLTHLRWGKCTQKGVFREWKAEEQLTGPPYSCVHADNCRGLVAYDWTPETGCIWLFYISLTGLPKLYK